MAAEHLRDARAAAEHAARVSYGRLVALLAAPSGDVALAEDAVAGAFEQALRTWPDQGVPANPDGWLLTVARNRQRDTWRSAAHRTSRRLEAGGPDEPATDPLAHLDPDGLDDHRLALLLACAHPDVDEQVRAPLVLQVVLGFDAKRIGAAFGVPKEAMAKRLVRAKARLRAAGTPLVVPGRDELAARVPTVLEAVHACYALAFDDTRSPDDPEAMAGEAQYLAVTLAALLEDEPEAWGLAALVTLSLARAPARRDGFVPLDEQDPATWDADLVAEGEAYLRRPSRDAAPGRFRLEAAAQAVHCDRLRTGLTDWPALVTLYRALVLVAPTLGARVALAAAIGRTDGPDAGLAALPDPHEGEAFQPWWATRADLLARDGRRQEAVEAYGRAAAGAREPSVRRWLEDRAASV